MTDLSFRIVHMLDLEVVLKLSQESRELVKELEGWTYADLHALQQDTEDPLRDDFEGWQERKAQIQKAEKELAELDEAGYGASADELRQTIRDSIEICMDLQHHHEQSLDRDAIRLLMAIRRAKNRLQGGLMGLAPLSPSDTTLTRERALVIFALCHADRLRKIVPRTAKKAELKRELQLRDGPKFYNVHRALEDFGYKDRLNTKNNPNLTAHDVISYALEAFKRLRS